MKEAINKKNITIKGMIMNFPKNNDTVDIAKVVINKIEQIYFKRSNLWLR